MPPQRARVRRDRPARPDRMRLPGLLPASRCRRLSPSSRALGWRGGMVGSAAQGYAGLRQLGRGLAPMRLGYRQCPVERYRGPMERYRGLRQESPGIGRAGLCAGCVPTRAAAAQGWLMRTLREPGPPTARCPARPSSFRHRDRPQPLPASHRSSRRHRGPLPERRLVPRNPLDGGPWGSGPWGAIPARAPRCLRRPRPF